MANKSRLTANIVSNTGISTFSTRLDISNGPVLIGTASSTGTASQPLQVTGGAYVSGNLGVGTTNALYKVHVEGNGAYNQILRLNDGSGVNKYIDYGFDGTGAYLFTPSPYYAFNIDSSEKVRITSTGVGIGTTNPSEKTHIYGTGDVKLQVETPSSGVNANTALYLKTLSEGSWLLQTGNAVSSGLRFYDVVAGAERLRVTSSGNVGIGITNPGNKLHFYTSSGTNRIQIDNGSDSSFIGYDGSTNDLQLASNNNIKFQTSGSYIERVRITSSGSVGIGTTNPLAQLSVGSKSLADANVPVQISTQSATGLAYYGANNNGSYGALFGYDKSAYSGLVIRSVGASDNIEFLVNNTTRAAIITSSGNLGIGTTNPTSTFQVGSAVSITSTGNQTLSGTLKVGIQTFLNSISGDSGVIFARELVLDNGGVDTPGINMYFSNNRNYGIDVAPAISGGGPWSGNNANPNLRIGYNLNESGGTVHAGMTTDGKFFAREFVGINTLGATMQVFKINEGPIDRHNYFYNSSFAVDQRHSGFAAPQTAVGAAVTYTVDRWYLYPDGANVTFQRQSTDIIGDTNKYSFDVNGAAGLNYIDFGQRLASDDSVVFAGNNITVSAYVKNTAGITTMRIDLAYPNSTENFSAGETTIGQKTVTMSGTTTRVSATFENISSFVSRGLSVRFRVYGLTSGVFSIACPQIEIGKVASDWSTVDISTEVVRCARFCQRLGYGVRTAVGNWGGAVTAYCTHWPHTPFRTTPTLYWYVPGKCLVEAVNWYDVGAVSIVESSASAQTFNLTSISNSGQSANANAVWGNGADAILTAEF